MLSEIFPSAVAVAEAFSDAEAMPLWPGEEVAIASAVEKRRREFTAVRTCARTALTLLGEPQAPIPAGHRGAPIWPKGIVGSMTHCAGYRGAAVARNTVMVTIGIDSEEHAPLPDDVLELIALPSELATLSLLALEHPQIHWDCLLFCAKESAYKAWFPLTDTWLGFEDAMVRFAPATTSFEVRLLVPGPALPGGELTRLRGRWLIRDGLVLTAIALAR